MKTDTPFIADEREQSPVQPNVTTLAPSSPVPSSEPPRQARPPSLVGPIILIGLGMLFLLTNLNLLAWNTWLNLLQLWPVLLIALGAEILIGRRSALLSATIVVATLCVLGVGFWLLTARGTPGGQETIDQALGGARGADVVISPSVTRLQITAGTADGALITGTVDRLRNERITQAFQLDGDTAYYTLRSERNGNTVNFNSRDAGWVLQLVPGVPLHLQVNTGVGQSTLDLRGLHLTGLDVRTGVGETTITLPSGSYNYGIVVNSGVGAVTLRVPRGAPARLTVDRGLGGLSVPATYQQDGDRYTAPGYAATPAHLEVQLKSGVGAINVEEYTP
jgi:hypothetical protein